MQREYANHFRVKGRHRIQHACSWHSCKRHTKWFRERSLLDSMQVTRHTKWNPPTHGIHCNEMYSMHFTQGNTAYLVCLSEELEQPADELRVVVRHQRRRQPVMPGAPCGEPRSPTAPH